MSETPYKRRLREWKRHIATDLTRQGYEVETYESSPFHVGATRGRSSLKIRICFGCVTEDDLKPIAALTSRGYMREIWQIEDGGRRVVRVKVSPPK